MVSEVGQMIEAYIELAALPAGKDEDSMAMPSTFRRNIKQLQHLPVVSKSVEVDPSCKYADLPHFAGFGDSISFVGGVNRPKLVRLAASFTSLEMRRHTHGMLAGQQCALKLNES